MSRAGLTLFLTLWLAVPAMAAEPEAVVDNFHAVLTDAMDHGAQLGCKGRVDKIGPVIAQTFDIPFIAAHILRKRWDKLTPDQRTAFTAILHDLIVQTYASNFSHPGPKFATLETNDSGPRKQVRTRLTPTHDEPVTLDYFLQKSGDGWKVINVIANGVSDLALRSSQYDKVFEQSGFDGLMAKLQKQVAADRAACSS